jgi:hypothetical protein
VAAFRVVQKIDEVSEAVVGWYVEQATDDGRAEIVTPLYRTKWEAHAEAEFLSVKYAGHHNKNSNHGI